MVTEVVDATPKIIGPFEVLEQIGRGGSARVYKARHATSQMIVALKVGTSYTQMEAEALERFKREFTVIRGLQHPNLVRPLALGEHDGISYLVLEYVAGLNLEQYLHERGCLAPHQAAAIFVQAAEGLRYLHQNKVVHRDIKPSNIFVGPDGQVKLGDFGLLKRLNDDGALTRSHQGMGTLEYGAPEQFEDAKYADRRCDLYSLAAAFYTALTGKYPFGLGGHLHILQRKLQNQFVPLRLLVAGLDPAVDVLINRCLHPNPDERPKSCDEFLEVMRRQRSHPTSTPPPEPEFGANAVQPRTSAERRARLRFEVDLTATFVPFHQKMRGRWDATILDVSPEGVRLQSQRAIAVHSVLQLTLGKGTRTELALVRWVRIVNDQTHELGCSFVRPLPRAEFDALYRSGRRTTVRHNSA